MDDAALRIPVHPFVVREGVERQDDLKDVAKNVMGGAWLDFPSESISVAAIGGGITNLLFKLDGPETENPVLVRIYGQDTEVLIDRERDNALYNELAIVGFAPPFHGRFTNGRVEGFLQARPLEPSQMSQRSPVDFVSLIAKELARLHRLSVTTVGPAGEAEMWQVLPKWLQLAKGLNFEDEAKASAIAELDMEWMCREAEWLKRQLHPSRERNGGGAPTKIASAGEELPASGGSANGLPGHESAEERAKSFMSDVVLCHNDLLGGNVLHAEGWDRVQVIDFEYSGFNHRGFDIANHFCEHAGFDSDYAKSYPTADTQKAFLRAYFRAAAPSTVTPKGQTNGTKHAGDTEESTACQNGTRKEGERPTPTTGGDGPIEHPGSDDEAFVEALRTEANRWTLPSHLSWAAWAVVQAYYSPIEFDFVDYARLRLAGYRLHKEAFFGTEE